MALSTGQCLGPFEILSPAGTGGMGEVYRARDTRLDRIVAVKILRTDSVRQAERRERFEREMRAVAALNHPHICVLHDIGSQDGIDYAVMEYLEGQTLSQRLVMGALPMDQALRCAIEIADALDKAHRAGITHRDLKPGNIMLTKSGAKLLDFGLAKFRETAVETGTKSTLPTKLSNLTDEGSIVGTLQYMAPEQLEGSDVDARTDIFAFGAVVFEMVTGRKVFERKSQASLIAAIMSATAPQIRTLQPLTSSSLDYAVTRCLAKDPDDRWQSARDLLAELKRAERESSFAITGDQAAIPGTHSRRRGRALAWAISSALLLGLGAVVGYIALTPSENKGVMRLEINAPTETEFADPATGSISPDGKRLAFVARDKADKVLIWVRDLNSFSAKPLVGTENTSFSFLVARQPVPGLFFGWETQEDRSNGWAASDDLRIA